MRTVEGIVACHVAVRERTLAGLPAWDRSIKIKDLFESDDDSKLDFQSESFDQEIEDIVNYFADMRDDEEPEGQLV